jgi:recombinational DNA repair protein RecR
MYFFPSDSYIVGGKRIDICYDCQRGKEVICPVNNTKRIVVLERVINVISFRSTA